MNVDTQSPGMLDAISEDALATVAHELRTPVQTIALWAKLIQRGTLTDEQSVRAVETILRSATAQAELIDDLLDRARIRRGELAMRRDRVDVRLPVGRAADAIFPLAHAKGIALEVITAGVPCMVLGDASRLEQVTRNVLANAVKFSSSASRIEVLVTKGAREVRVSVRDSGIGVRRDLLPHVFDRYRSGDGEPGRGLGLGLAIAQHIVLLHGGSIAIRSEGEGRGATVSMLLPSVSVGPNVDAPRRQEGQHR